MNRLLAAAPLLIALLAPAASTEAQGLRPPHEHRLRWDEDWNRFGTGEIAALSFLTIGGVGLHLHLVPDQPGPEGGWLLDDWVREGLHLSSPGGRSAAATASDILVSGAILYPFLIDTAAVTWIGDHNDDVANQMLWINVLSFVTTNSLLSFIKNVVRRERPFGPRCEDDPAYDSSCEGADRYRSFFSGHSANAFTGASLVCVHHANLPLYGNRLADAGACMGAMTVAVAVAVLRIVADKHYLSDVVVGAVAGILSGLLMPHLLHYGLDPN